jgi:hypothetical protein
MWQLTTTIASSRMWPSCSGWAYATTSGFIGLERARLGAAAAAAQQPEAGDVLVIMMLAIMVFTRADTQPAKPV